MPKTVEVTEEYKKNVRKCVIDIRPTPASEGAAAPKEMVYVDWRNVLYGEPEPTGQPAEANTWVLGMDPTLDPPAWVDESLRFAPAPAWARNETYIAALEAENAMLKEKLRNNVV